MDDMEPELEQYQFGDNIVAFSTTRHGGASKGNFGELNINPYCGDDPQDVNTNLKALCHTLEIPTDRLILPHQTHQTVCRAITPAFFSLSEAEKKEYLEGVDAVMTDMTDVCVGVSTADCIPLLYYDTEHKAVAAVHAGWRGTLAGIATKALDAMAQQYGTQPGKVKIMIGPGISLKNFEVGDEVYELYAQAFPFIRFMSKRFDKWHLDLQVCNRLQLLHAGARLENIVMSSICTFDQAERFFSARRLGANSGRIYNGIMKKGDSSK